MAKIIETKKDFKVIEVDRREMVSRLGQYGALGICDSCAWTAENGFYVAVLNQWLCPECYQEWLGRAVYYPEDRAVEYRNFEYYKFLFGL